jgi:hypothetical protein
MAIDVVVEVLDVVVEVLDETPLCGVEYAACEA